MSESSTCKEKAIDQRSCNNIDSKSHTSKVMSATSKILNSLSETRELSSTKADLAHLRNSVGKPIREAWEVWPLLFESIDSELLSDGYKPSYAEIAIFTTLQLYAIHQQGKAENVACSDDITMGTSLKVLRKETREESKAIDRRFNTLVTSTTFEELAHHLRQMIKLLKSKSDGKVNYVYLARDLFRYLNGYDDSIKMSWSRDYYRLTKKEGEKEDETKQ